MHKKYSLILMFGMILLFGMMFVSAKPPVQTTTIAPSGLEIEATSVEYLTQGADHTFHFRVYDAQVNNYTDPASVTCGFGLIDKFGNFIYNNADVTTVTGYVYNVNVTGGNFTELGAIHKGINCQLDDGSKGAVLTQSFQVNGFGEGLDIAHSFKFNSAMFFMLILFGFALVGLFVTENYIGKLALYWVTHVLFIVGTFSMWQFNAGYTTVFMGMAGIWKVLFYVRIGAVVPMVILSMAWIFYIHTFNEHFQKLVDKGNDTETAFRMAKKKSGGWFGGGSSGR